MLNPNKVEIYPKRECEKCRRAVKKMGRGPCGFSSIGLGQKVRVETLKENFEKKLKEREDELLCKECGSKMEVVENEFGTHFLRCKSFPKCKFRHSVDILSWPNRFSW